MNRPLLARKLIELRKSHNLRQEDVSAYLSISRSGYSQYETGRYIPSSEILLKLATLYNIDISELVNSDIVPIYVDKISDKTNVYDDSISFSIADLNNFFSLCKVSDPDFDINALTQENLNTFSLFKQLTQDEQEDLKLFIECKLKKKAPQD